MTTAMLGPRSWKRSKKFTIEANALNEVSAYLEPVWISAAAKGFFDVTGQSLPEKDLQDLKGLKDWLTQKRAQVSETIRCETALVKEKSEASDQSTEFGLN